MKKLLLMVGMAVGALLVINVGIYFFLNATQPKTTIGKEGAELNAHGTKADSTGAHPAETAAATTHAKTEKEPAEKAVEHAAAPEEGHVASDKEDGAHDVSATPQEKAKELAAADEIAKAVKQAEAEKEKADQAAESATKSAAAGDPKEINKLAKLLDSMKPKDAAAIATDLNVDVIVTLIMKMKDRNAAKMMAEMPSEVAAKVALSMSDKAKVAGRK